MRYELQRGQDMPAQLPYSYGRRAQSTVYQWQWKGILLSDDAEILQKAVKRPFRYPDRYRILDRDTGEHKEVAK